MPEYLAPGVYVEEISAGPPPIEGVGTSTTAFVGMTRRGPTRGRPLLVTNYGEFVRTFGGAFTPDPTFAGFQDLPHAARGYFANGGRRLYVSRAAPTTATAAGVTTSGGVVTRLLRSVPPTQTTAQLQNLRGIQVGTQLLFRMVRDGITTDSLPLQVNGIDAAQNQVTLNGQLSGTLTFDAGATTVLTGTTGLAADGTLTGGAPPAARPGSIRLVASSPGAWGRDVRIASSHQSAARTVLDAFVSGANNDNRLRLVTSAGFYVGAWVEMDRGNAKIYRPCTAVTGAVITLAGPAMTAANVAPQAPATQTRVATCEFGMTVAYEDPVERVLVTERFDGLTLAPVPGRSYLERLSAAGLIADGAVVPADQNPLVFPMADDGAAIVLSGGTDGTAAPTTGDFVGTDNGPNQRSGLLAVEDVDEVAILAAPGVPTTAVQLAVIEQCERLMDRFAVLDPVTGASGTPATLQQIQDQRDLYDTKYAALYYPRVLVANPLGGPDVVVPPSGHVCGVFARTDITRGVHKAPANELIRGILGYETVVSRQQQEILNPRNINVLRDMRTMQRGLRVYGARCLTGDAEWNYVNVRRLFIYLEESLDEGTQWVVFEPNDQRLWARVIESVSIFLRRVWRDGALMGAKPEEAFYVRCDRSTMSDDDILNGRLILEIGVAPVRPAEFVIIRIGQWLGGSSRQEL